jgi:Flp pilus assembly protein TadG
MKIEGDWIKAMRPMTRMWLRVRRSARDLSGDCRGLAAVEFAMVVPLMLVLFFGVVDFSRGIAVDRKVTLMARTLSDLTSQNISVTDTRLTDLFNAGNSIIYPYSKTPLNSTITELYVDPTTKVARVQWSKGASPRGAGTTVPIPTALQVGDTFLIFSEVSYNYVPLVAFVDEVRDQYERFHLYPPAPVGLRDLQHPRLHADLKPAFSGVACPRI